MRTLAVLPKSLSILLAAAASFPPIAAAEAGVPVALRAYGEALYSRYDFGPDQKSGTNGSPPDERAVMDVPRFALEIVGRLPDDFFIEAEIEYEHNGAGASVELEYEEFGEYEIEAERGGEVRLEEMFLAKRLPKGFEVRAGRIVVPVGMANRYHKPTDYFTAVQAESEAALLPVTWSEIGARVAGTIRGLGFQILVVNALDSSGFSSKNWISGGQQGRFELTRATDLAAVLALRQEPAEGLVLGASVYRGNSTGNRPKPDMQGVNAPVTIADLHVRIERGPWIARAAWLAGTVQNADEISSKNSRLSVALGVPRTPVAREARLWFAEAGAALFARSRSEGGMRLIPFVRYEYYDSMYETDDSIFDDPRFERKTLTAGLNIVLNENATLKGDYAHRVLGEDRFNDENTWSVGFAFRTN